ncbi:nuclear polyadenylated RNA-binding protein 3 [Sporothrix epigloea]|uniref:Nuclear polyadenylated RNA-binding protein 3 n=1 Tax=Sporothrix epigloea TaxID=1892477 RepID=A0ABP0DF11_9PEZI
MSEAADAPHEVLSFEHISSPDVVLEDNTAEDAGQLISSDRDDALGDDDADGETDADEAGIAELAAEGAIYNGAPLAPLEDEAALNSASPMPPIENTTDVVLPAKNRDTAFTAVGDQPSLDTLDDASVGSLSSPAATSADWLPDSPEADGQDLNLTDQGHDEVSSKVGTQNVDEEINADVVDADPEKSDTTDLSDVESSEDLPYIADIAMLDTGELDGLQEEEETSGEGPNIDLGKVIGAIQGDSTKLPASDDAANVPPIGAPKGPSNSFPRPPTGPAQGTAKHANQSLTSEMTAAATPGGTGGKGSTKSQSALPAAGGRRGRGNRGQSPAASRQTNAAREKAAVDRAYQAFLNEEKIHVAENKWDAFPEGSRMFVGNLSQERVSKRDVFEQFHRYGRLAQISIKSAYGFVQYHSAEEATAALANLEGAEIRGRKIHLEVSRPPKKEKDNGRDGERGSDRARGRGGRNRSPEPTKSRGGRGGDRYDGRAEGNQRHQRDGQVSDSRGGHEPASHRGNSGFDSSARDRDRHGKLSRRSRERSRSPHRYDSHGDDGRGYRSRRSPSPYGRSRNDAGRGGHDGTRSHHNGDILDVQFLAAQGLEWEFIKWVQSPFSERGLKTDILYLTSNTPSRDSIIQMHVLGGITAVVDLDSRAQATGLIPVQVFNRSAGEKKVLFDGYRDLTPPVAADVVVRAKAAAVVQQHQPAYAQGYPSTSSSSKPYVPPYQLAAPASAAVHNSTPDLAGILGQLDNATLAQVLGALQPQQAPAAATAPPTSYAQVPPTPSYAAPGGTTQQAQLAALLSTLGATASAPAAPYGIGAPAAPYAAGVPTSGHATAQFSSLAPGTEDQTVQAILAQFAQSRQ